MALDMMRESRAKGRDQTIESFHQARRGTHDSESLLQSQILCNMQREGMYPCLVCLAHPNHSPVAYGRPAQAA